MNKNTVVIYKSKYGSTKRYAGWIALRLDADLYEVGDISSNDLNRYDTIIYGGGIYLGKINGFKFIEKNIDRIKNKNILVFTVGMESTNEHLVKSIIEKNFNDELKEKIKLFTYRGAIDYSKLNLKDKVLMKGLKQMISKKNIRSLTEDDKIVLESFEREVDLCDKKEINSLIESI